MFLTGAGLARNDICVGVARLAPRPGENRPAFPTPTPPHRPAGTEPGPYDWRKGPELKGELLRTIELGGMIGPASTDDISEGWMEGDEGVGVEDGEGVFSESSPSSGG